MTTRDATLSVDESPDLSGYTVRTTLDAGEENCATLILSVREAISALTPGEVLAVVAYDPSADLDLRAWCRMTGNRFLGRRGHDHFAIYYLEKHGGS